MAADSGPTDRGGGVPRGYLASADDGKPVSGASYRENNGRWEISTGPAHIMYAPSDTMSGAFTVATTFDQVEAPAHAEAFGLFIGGSDLDRPTMRYTYFLVRGTGEYLVKIRDGAETRDVIPWTPHDAVAKQTSEGKGRYRVAIQVRSDSIRFLVGGRPVGAVKAGSVPTDGIAGFRVNHNLRIKADHLRGSRG